MNATCALWQHHFHFWDKLQRKRAEKGERDGSVWVSTTQAWGPKPHPQHPHDTEGGSTELGRQWQQDLWSWLASQRSRPMSSRFRKILSLKMRCWPGETQCQLLAYTHSHAHTHKGAHICICTSHMYIRAYKTYTHTHTKQALKQKMSNGIL